MGRGSIPSALFSKSILRVYVTNLTRQMAQVLNRLGLLVPSQRLYRRSTITLQTRCMGRVRSRRPGRLPRAGEVGMPSAHVLLLDPSLGRGRARPAPLGPPDEAESH
jgi:hypothetical protein